MTNDEYIKCLSFWTLSSQYLTLAENAARETVAHDNAWGVFTSPSPSPDELDEKWRWSDHRIGMPVLFTLYHGLELLVKGFILARDPDGVEAHHGIQEWVEQFVLLFPEEADLCDRFQKYTQSARLPDLIRRFLADNRLQFGQLYEALRYPTDRYFSNTKRYVELKYKGADGLDFFRELMADLACMRKASARLALSFKQ